MIGAIEPNGSTGLSHGDPCTLVIFGASGDLTGRKLVPALFHLACSGCLAEDFQILGVARDPWDSAVFRDRMRAAVSASAEIHQFDAAHWSMFVSRLDYLQAEFSDPEAYRRVAAYRAGIPGVAGSNRLFYFATPPSAYAVLLLDAMQGDPTLFTRRDGVEAQWRLITPIEAAWHTHNAPPLVEYAAGSDGPAEADALLADDGHTWRGIRGPGDEKHG